MLCRFSGGTGESRPTLPPQPTLRIQVPALIIAEHKLKLSDKKGALDSLARYLEMFADKVKHEGGITLAGQVNVYLPDNGRDKRD